MNARTWSSIVAVLAAFFLCGIDPARADHRRRANTNEAAWLSYLPYSLVASSLVGVFAGEHEGPQEGVAPGWVTDADRLDVHLVTDAATPSEGSFRLDLSGGFVSDSLRSPAISADLSIHRVDLVIARGQHRSEFGIRIPYVSASLRVTDATQSFMESASGLGDVVGWGKGKVVDSEHFDLALGLATQAPTGDEEEGLGSGFWGFDPFLAFRLSVKRFAFGAHGGKLFFYDTQIVHDVFSPDRQPPPDVLHYGGYLLGKLGNRVTLRAEYLTESASADGFRARASILAPGVELKFSPALRLRVSGAFGLNDAARDRGVNVGFVWAF